MSEKIPACFGISFSAFNMEQANQFVFSRQFQQIVTINSEFIAKYYEDKPKFKQIINSSVCTIDGQVPLWLAKLFGDDTVGLKKVSGSRYSKNLLDFCMENKLKIFLLGGEPGSICKIKRQIDKPDYISGFCPEFSAYPFSEALNCSIRNEIKAFSPDLLLVGFGAVKQEYWIYDNRHFLSDLGIRSAIGVGGTFEMLSGKVKSAPHFVHNLGLESLYRFIQQPSFYRLKKIIDAFKVFKYLTRNE